MFFVRFLLCIFLFGGCATALPLGNPSDPALYPCTLLDLPFRDGCAPIGLRLGYYGDIVVNRYTKIDGAGLHRGKVMQIFDSSTNALYVDLNLFQRFDFFSTFGSTNFHVINSEIAWATAAGVPNGGSMGEFWTDKVFSWSVGGRCILLERCGFTLGLEGQYFSTKPHIMQYASYYQISFSSKAPVHYEDYQVGLGVSYNIAPTTQFLFVPYAGIKWSDCRFNTHNVVFSAGGTEQLTIFNLKGERHVGYAVGCTSTWFGCYSLSVEGRFVDELALSVNGQMNF